MSEKMTFGDVLILFGHPSEDARWLSAADSAEYLEVVTYLVSRGLGNGRR